MYLFIIYYMIYIAPISRIELEALKLIAPHSQTYHIFFKYSSYQFYFTRSIYEMPLTTV